MSKIRVDIALFLKGALWALLIYLVSLLPLSVDAKETSYSDAHIKAAYILKLEGFVDFPASDKGNRICIVGDDLIGSSMAQIAAGKKNHYKIDKTPPSSNFDGCRIVFIGESVEESLGQILHVLNKQPALTVSDIKNFVLKNGMIGFVNIGGRIKLEVNVKPAQESNLSISSRLLEVSHRVIR